MKQLLLAQKRRLFKFAIPVLLALALFGPLIPQQAEAATYCYNGTYKTIETEPNGTQHHLVIVNTYVSAYYGGWYITSAPLQSSIWVPKTTYQVRIGYSWPYNWWDPYPASWWRVCINR